jgi:LacI family transcriptional regulator
MLVNMPSQVTSFDVAREAGVSQPTVSRALRNLPGVSQPTKDRVLAAARRLAYVPSDSGRALSTRITRRVAVVAPELTNPYYPQLLEPIRQALGEQGLRTTLVLGRGVLNDESTVLDDLTDGSFDGVILTTTRRRDSLPRDLTERGIPHVLVNRLLDVPESSGCAINNTLGGELVADLVVELGHTDIGMLAGPSDTSTGKERSAAVRRRLRRHDVPLRRENTASCEFDYETARVAAVRLLDRAGAPTALICGNDVIALGALSAARDLGRVVPEELTIIGFDDIAMAEWPIVNLTTVHCDLQGLARGAVQLLISVIADPTIAPSVERLRPELVLRGTHGPPRPMPASNGDRS